MASVDRSEQLRLKPLQVTGFPDPIELEDGKLSFGRGESNHVRLAADVFPSVSQNHARIEVAEDGLWVEDLGSRNGTLVNGEKAQRALLSAGDELRMGRLVLKITGGPSA